MNKRKVLRSIIFFLIASATVTGLFYSYNKIIVHGKNVQAVKEKKPNLVNANVENQNTNNNNDKSNLKRIQSAKIDVANTQIKDKSVAANPKQEDKSNSDTPNNENQPENSKPINDKQIVNNENQQINTEKMDNLVFDANQATNVLNKTFVKDGKKIVCLTFDDGPSTTVTPQILDVLKRYDVKATFFLIGSMVEKGDASKSLVREIRDNGNSIGNHTYSHEYRTNIPTSLYYGNKINVQRYMDEIDRTNNKLNDVLGQDFKTRITRMPGGHISREYYHDPNLQQFDDQLQKKGMVSIDWNASDGDADGKWKNADQLVEETKITVGNQEKVILLMHDTYGKEETAKALPRIIEYLKAQGYEFRIIK